MIYFVSDIHLGVGDRAESQLVESRFVAWLDSVAEDAEAIFINGDLFDFWYEYRGVVPKGFVRTLGRFASLTQRGVRVVFMTGNHDQWVGDYLAEECGVEIYTEPKYFDLCGLRVHVAHGHGLNVKGDPILKLINSTFGSGWVRALFSTLLHPDLAMRFGHWWSTKSRAKHDKNNHASGARALEYIKEFSAKKQSEDPCDCYIFGHLHQALDFRGEGGLRVMVTDDWCREEPRCITIDKSGDIQLKVIKQ
ncbi:MAG: UDP-2,3-diacylglucosamine diphosphatase [Rikenellaceae bacterium]